MPLANAALKVDGTSYPLVAVSGREEVGAHFRIDVRAWGPDADPKKLLGKPFSLVLDQASKTELTIAGVVVGARWMRKDGEEELRLALGPEHELLAHGQASTVYLAKTSADIAKAVVALAGLAAARWSAATPPAREYTAQYRESDSTFVDRIVREDGVYWFYDHDGGTTLTFADDSTNAPELGATFAHRHSHGAVVEGAWVTRLVTRTTARSEKLTTRDYDPKKPKLALEGAATAANGAREVYEWPAVAAAAGDARKRAQAGLDALRARALVVNGFSDRVTMIRCGKRMAIESRSLPAALTSLFVIEVEWSIDEDGERRVVFGAVPAATPFRLPLRPRTHASLGVETAWVRGASGQEIDVDANGDAFVQPPWDRNTKKDDSVAIRSRSGQMQLARSMTMPRIGWGMLVGHREGDVDRPWIIARLVDGAHPLPYKLPDNMTQTAWQTLTSKSDGTLSEIVFEDKKDAEKIALHAAKDMQVEIGNDEARTVGNNHVLEVDKDRAETVDADDKLTVTADQATTVKGDEATTIEGSRSLTLKGNEETTVSGKRAEAVTADRTVDVGKKRTLTVSGTMAASSKKGLTREVLKKATMTAAAGWTTQAEGGLVTTTKGDATVTVAAARMQNGKNGVATAVKGDFSDTVAAAHAITAKGGVGEAAKAKSSLTVGAALVGTAPEIEIIAESEIAIQCGGSTITIKSSEVTIKAPTMAVAGPVVVINGAQVKHNP